MHRMLLNRGFVPLAVAVTTLIALSLGTLIAAEVHRDIEDAAPDRPAASKLTQLLGGDMRYQTHLSTDKPVYRGGETLYVRGVVLNAFDRTPLPLDNPAVAEIEIKGPKGDTVARGALTSEDSVLGFKWQIPDEQAGGEYTIKVAYPWQGFAPAERKFDIRQFRAPRLKTQIVFVRDGYGPGDQVNASVSIKRAEGSVPEGAKVTAVARVDGQEVHRGSVTMDKDGNASATFELPKEIDRGEGTLAFIVEDGGVVETATKTIPILLQTLDISFYPESGDMVAGLPSRVYFEAKQPNRKPADFKAVVEGLPLPTEMRIPFVVAEVETEHEGRGRFTFTPDANRKYRLRITQPSGISRTFPLPESKPRGVVIEALGDAFDHDQPLRLKVHGSSRFNDVRLVVSRKEKQLAETTVSWDAADRPIAWSLRRQFTPKQLGDAAGVFIATAYDSDGKPLAERLVFRKPKQQVHIDIEANKNRYIPGDNVDLTIKTTDENGQPVSAVVGVSVTDDSVLEMIEKREQAPRLPVMVFLEPNVKELADAHVFLDPDNDKAELATDLLLGTQGWRRFATQDITEFAKNHGADARRALAMRVPDPRRRHEWLTVGDGRWVRFADNGDMIDAEPARKLAVGKSGAVVEEATVVQPASDVARRFGGRAVPGGLGVANAAEAKGAEMAAGEKKDMPDNVRGDLKKKREQVANVLAEDELRADADIAGGAFAAREPSVSRQRQRRNDFVVVREYAHQVRADRRPGDRTDFADTLYFHAGIRTDAKTGQATVQFGLSDAVTGFRVLADGFTESGALGSGDVLIESVEPFYIEPKMPLELTSGDVVHLPVAIVNGTNNPLEKVALDVSTADGIDVLIQKAFALEANGRDRRIVSVNTKQFVGDTGFTVSARAGTLGDRNTRKLRVMPLGFPATIAHGGLLEADSKLTHTVSIPDDYVPQSIRTEIKVFPSPMANMTSAMERLIREPNGCFEQTSSTTYPLVMAQQYFTSHQGVDPALIQRSGDILLKGYNRLLSFECKSGGYEWFGKDPGHEALTAYGLMQFTDMNQVMQVDNAMLDRTRNWLLDQRDGEGNFKRGRRALHTWITDPDCSNGYILWSLISTGTDVGALQAEINAFREAASKSDNSYVVALGANVLADAGEKEAARELLGRLTELQHEDGYIEGATTSIVGSGGNALTIETTALAQLAFLRDKHFAGNVERAHKWLAEQCEGGRYGSTQSTVLAIKAIVAYDEARAAPKAPGEIHLFVDGRQTGSPVAFDKDAKETFLLTDVSELLTPGEHEIELRMEDGSRMPYAITVNYNRTQPDASDDCKLRLTAKLNDTKLKEGNVTEAQVTVSNVTDEVVPTPVAIIGIPGGLEVRHDQLKELRDKGTIAAYEVIGREVVLYWREIKAKTTVELPLSLVAAVPGTYTAPASRAYLYYTDEHKQWIAPLSVEIAAQ